MDSTSLLPKLALIAGPTASGKSQVALALAKSYAAQGQSAVIINADSAQVYADLSVLSARPTAGEMQSVPHHLYGYIDGAEACSAARWAADARACIESAVAAGAIPILVGGTGLYIRTLLDGIAPIPPIDPDVRAKVRKLRTCDAFHMLVRLDPDRAAMLNPADTSRVARALEIVQSTGLPMAHWQSIKTGGISDSYLLKPLILLPPRDWLYARCDARFAAMLDAGALAEVSALLARNLPPDAPVMRAIGVPECAALIRGEITRDQAIAAAQLATRRYAKRQYTWFRNQSPADWPRWEQEINMQNSDKIVTLFQ